MKVAPNLSQDKHCKEIFLQEAIQDYFCQKESHEEFNINVFALLELWVIFDQIA